MKKQRRGLKIQHATRRKKEEKFSIHMQDTLKTNCEEKTQEKKKKKGNNKKTGVNGIRTHTHENRRLLVYIYSKNERSTYCAIESLKNYLSK